MAGPKASGFSTTTSTTPNLLSNDTGATYAWKTEAAGSEIAYNWIHHIVGHTNGVYLDNFCNGFRVHHNVIWNARNIRLNSDATNHLIANNTLYGDRPFGTFCYYNYTPNPARHARSSTT